MSLNSKALPRKCAIAMALATGMAATSLHADNDWYVGATGGITSNGVSSLDVMTDDLSGRASADADNGYTMGAVFGREFDGRWRLEGEFRYRTNEFASVDLPDGSRITNGDFSSGALGVNAYWLFGDTNANWRPFIGAGLAWMQEIDLDLADDPLVTRGLASRLFDGEGIAAKRLPLIEGGVLKNYYIDTYYGKKLKMAPTTGARSNLQWALGSRSQEQLLAEVRDAILVTRFIGGNSNGTTGDFSFGVQGFRVRNGRIAEPVSEMNISGKRLAVMLQIPGVSNMQ